MNNVQADYVYELIEERGDHLDTLQRYKIMIRRLCEIIQSEYPESDDRYEFAGNCLTDVGEE